MSNIWLAGICGSFAGGLLLLLLQWFWRSLLPDIMSRVSKGEPRISGKWKTSFEEDGKSYSETVNLRQLGRNVTAEISLKEEDDETIYRFKGTFRNLILSGTYWSQDETDFERGAILLRYAKKKFVGQNAFFSKTSENLVASDYEWVRSRG